MGTKADDKTLLCGVTLWAGCGHKVKREQDVLVAGSRIEAVGENLPRAGARIVDGKGDLLLPGFQQMHVHACQTLFRGEAEDQPLLPWLKKFIWPMEAAHTAESLRSSTELTVLELLRSGTTAVFSFETVRHSEVVGQVYRDLGLRATFAPCLMDESAGVPSLAVSTKDSLAEIEALVEIFSEHERVGVGVAPRFALACKEESLRETAAFAREKDLPLQTHANEQLAEIALVRERTGRGNIEFLIDCGLSGEGVSLVHGVHLTEGEKAQLRERGLSLVHCPSANAKLGSGIAPVKELLAAGVPCSLGSDGAACNNRLDMFAEMRLAAFLQKIARGAEALPVETILSMATRGGRSFLPNGSLTGELRPGFQADMIRVSLSGWHCAPSNSPLTDLVYSAQPEDIRMTMVAGKILYEDGQYPGIDAERIRATAWQERKQLLQRVER